MKISDLIPWRRKKQDIAARQNEAVALSALQSDIDRAFEEFWRGVSLPFSSVGRVGFLRELDKTPRVDVRENKQGIEVSVDLPGLDESDVDVRVANDILIIEAEKAVEREEEDNDFVLRERRYGRVSRALPLPDGLDLDAVKATFKKGLLKVFIPRLPGAEASVKRIQVKQE